MLSFIMAKQRLFPQPPKDDKRDPRDRFSDVAIKVFSVPKSDIDEREKHWRKTKQNPT